MKKILAASFLVLISAAPSPAALKVIGYGRQMHLDVSGFPPEMREDYKVVQDKCVQCHTMERIIMAVKTGLGPVSGLPFDKKAVAAYGERMLKRSNPGMSSAEVQKAVDFLDFLIDEMGR